MTSQSSRQQLIKHAGLWEVHLFIPQVQRTVGAQSSVCHIRSPCSESLSLRASSGHPEMVLSCGCIGTSHPHSTQQLLAGCRLQDRRQRSQHQMQQGRIQHRVVGLQMWDCYQRRKCDCSFCARPLWVRRLFCCLLGIRTVSACAVLCTDTVWF